MGFATLFYSYLFDTLGYKVGAVLLVAPSCMVFSSGLALGLLYTKHLHLQAARRAESSSNSVMGDSSPVSSQEDSASSRFHNPMLVES